MAALDLAKPTSVARRRSPSARSGWPAALAALVAVAAACGGYPPPPSPPGPSSVGQVKTEGPGLIGDCPVTVGDADVVPPPLIVEDPTVLPVPWVDRWYGNDAMWVRLPREGVLPASPDQGRQTISTKFPWWRVLSGQLSAMAQSLDRDAGHFEADVRSPAEYGPTGFVPSTLTFDHPGCWEITGSIQGSSLSFIVQVVEQPL